MKQHIKPKIISTLHPAL